MIQRPHVDDQHASFTRARTLANTCRWRRAHKACVQALRDEPGHARAIALNARVEAHLGLISNARAKEIIRDQIREHPGDVYLEVAEAGLMAQAGDRPGAIVQLRAIAEEHQDDAYAHQVLAGLLGCDKATWDEAWSHYKVAMQTGPLLAPGYMGAAYFFARRYEPALAPLTLRGTTPLQRAAIRTRAMGFNRMLVAFLVLALGSLALNALGHSTLSIVPMVMATAWAGWSSLANYTVGCWKCAAAWLALILLFWIALALSNSLQDRATVWYVIAGIIVAVTFQTVKQARAKSSPVPSR